MTDIYREDVGENNPMPENIEQPQLSAESVPEQQPENPVPAEPEVFAQPEVIETVPAKEESRGFDFSRQGEVSPEEMAVLKSLVDIVAAKGNEGLKEAVARANEYGPHMGDLLHDFLTNEENQKKLGIEQI